MILQQAGHITDRLYMLGPPANPVYLLDGHHPVLFDAGFACFGPIYETEILPLLDGRHPEWLLLSHCHFDHCGAVAFLQKRFPRMTVAASPLARKMLDRPKVLWWMEKFSEEAREMNGAAPGATAFEPFAVDRDIGENDFFEAGDGLTIRVLETPGHTRDSLSFFIPALNALICSEAAGIPDPGGYIYADFLIGYEPYRASLLKLQSLDPDIICLGHHAVYTGGDARNYLADALRFCDDFYCLVREKLHDAGGDIQTVMADVRAFEYDPKPWPKQTENAYLMNLEARVNAVRRQMEAEA